MIMDTASVGSTLPPLVDRAPTMSLPSAPEILMSVPPPPEPNMSVQPSIILDTLPSFEQIAATPLATQPLSYGTSTAGDTSSATSTTTSTSSTPPAWIKTTTQILGALSNALGLGSNIVSEAMKQDITTHQINMEDAAMNAAVLREKNAAVAQTNLQTKTKKIADRQLEASSALSTTKKERALLQAGIDAQNQLASNQEAIDDRRTLQAPFYGSPVA